MRSIMKSWETSDEILEIKRLAANYLWKTMNVKTKDIIQSYLDDVKADDISYAMHIRRGDKVTEANIIKTKTYINAMEKLIQRDTQKRSTYRIFVASDESNIINELQRLKPEWKFVKLSAKTIEMHGHEQSIFDHLPKHVQLELTYVLLSELEILSRVKHVVCTFSSNVCRLVQVLRKQDPNTVISLDEKWHPL
ncbi:hypothetical protein I4U23_017876 [Adineta vaga]|nr:hypothetical protein I4U23_017876 [Adineta vaga]